MKVLRCKGYELQFDNGGVTVVKQVYIGNYHWLPWCTFVEVDPVSRMLDTFGVYEIAEAEKLPMEERQKRNRILDDYFAK